MANEIWIPSWMMAPGASSNFNLTPEEQAAWHKQAEEKRKKMEEDAIKVCDEVALKMQAVPLFGQAASAAFYPACVASARGGIPSLKSLEVFGPVKQDPAMLAELQRGAPRWPSWQNIIDPTPEKARADKMAYEKYLRAYSLWKEADLRRFVPDMTRQQWDALPDSERQARAMRIQAYATAAFKIYEPKWLRMVLQDRAKELLDQLKEWTAPTLAQRVKAHEYVALAVAALVAIAAVAFATAAAGRRPRPRQIA